VEQRVKGKDNGAAAAILPTTHTSTNLELVFHRGTEKKKPYVL
jgi:hypothetical protein